MKIWLFGDSFASNNNGWAKIATYNYATNGSSEYRIWRTYQEHKHKIKNEDRVIFCHTSTSRVFLKDDGDLLSRKLASHPKCDIIFNDIYSKQEENFINILEHIWDEQYFTDTFNLLVNDLKSVSNSTHLTFFDSDTIESFYDVWQDNRGTVNHMNDSGNSIISYYLNKRLHNHKRLVVFGASLSLGAGLEHPETDSYPSRLAKTLHIPLDNRSVGGCSNLQILHDILNYQFNDNDLVILMWAPADRDYIFDKTKNTTIGHWVDPEIVKHWATTHSDYDLHIRSWLYIHQAFLYLKNKNVNFYNFAGYLKPFNDYKPDYINIELLDSKVDKYKLITKNASDGHPGPEAHKMLAEHILKIIK